MHDAFEALVALEKLPLFIECIATWGMYGTCIDVHAGEFTSAILDTKQGAKPGWHE